MARLPGGLAHCWGVFVQVVTWTNLLDLAELGTEAVTADGQLSSIRQGCVGKMGVMWQENFTLKSPKIMIFGVRRNTLNSPNQS